MRVSLPENNDLAIVPLTLGKSLHRDQGFISACYDEVLLIRPSADEQLPTPGMLNGSSEPIGNGDTNWDARSLLLSYEAIH